MSNYVVNGNGPTVVIPLSIPWTDDALIRNTGSKPVFLNGDPGIYTNGFELGPNASKIWNSGQGLYVQCNPGDVSTVDVQINTGEFYSAAPLNVPRVLWNARNVPTLDGQCPGRLTGSGEGPDFFTFDTSSPTPASDTGVIDVSNYSSIIVSTFEYQPDTWSVNRELRRVQITWYIQLSDGTYYATSDVYHYHYCLGTVSVTEFGQPEAQPQFKIITPAQAQYVRIRVSGVTFVDPVPADSITYTLLVIGDNRTIPEPEEYYDSGFYYTLNEFGTYSNEDMSVSDLCSGNASLAGGTHDISLTHRGGPHKFYIRLANGNTTTATVNNRALLQAVGTFNTNFIAGYAFTQGVAGMQAITDTIYLPRRPVILQIINNMGAAATFNWSLVPIRQ